MIELTLSLPKFWKPFPWATTKVRISQNALDCVAFLGSANVDGTDFEPFATAFLYRPLGHHTLYLITAKHCVDGDTPFWVRHNLAGGGADAFHIDEPEWTFHDDSSVDIAVLEFPESLEEHWIKRVIDPHTRQGWRGPAMGRNQAQECYGPGDLIYAVGLFPHHFGAKRNLPLVHTGHIAAFSEGEKIEVADWESRGNYKLIDAYIVQCAVMPGGSGSPVFARRAIAVEPKYHSTSRLGTNVPQDVEERLKGYGPLDLLGVWHGSWDMRADARAITRNPSGYGIVIPAQKITEILEMPKLRQNEEARKRQDRAKKNPPVPDSLPRGEAQDRFDTTLRQMVNTPPNPKKVTGK